jgi:hypothetical protein
MAATNVQVFSGDVEIASNVTAASSKFSLYTNGTLKQIGAGLNNNYIKLMKYFGGASNWKIATGSYLGDAWQWLSIRVKMSRLNQDVKIIQFNYIGSGGISRVRDSIVIGGVTGATQDNEIKVYNKTSNSTYEIYLQIDSATSVEVEITHRGSTIDDDYSTVATANNGAIDETGLTKIYDSGTTTDLRLKEGSVGIGTNAPGGLLEIWGSSSNYFRFDPLASNDTSIVDRTTLGATSFFKKMKMQLENRAWYFGVADDNTKFALAYDGGGGEDPDIVFAVTYSGGLYAGDVLGKSGTFTGNVGIGTTTPQQKLEVHGNILLGRNDVNAFIHAGGNMALSSDSDILIVSDSNDTGGVAGADIIFGAGSAIDMDDNRDCTYAQAFPSGVPRLEYMRILGSNGNVGIGNAGPQGKLQVSSTAKDSSDSANNVNQIRIDCTNSLGYAGTGGGITFCQRYFSGSGAMISTGGVFGARLGGTNGSYGGGLVFKYNPGGSMQVGMVINKNGNVGIGLTNPGTIGSTNYPNVTPILHLMGFIYQSEPNDNETWAIGVSSNDYFFRVSVNGNAITNVAKIGYTTGAYSDLIAFTGQHRAAHIESIPPTKAEDYEGLIVSADRNKYESVNGYKSRGIKAITVNEAMPLLSLSKMAYDKKCFGVISASEDPDSRTQRFGNLETYHYKEPGDTFIFINSLGEGAMWVVNTAGPLESGDYITTSNVAGYGQKQESEFLANYTVAKITMDCDFEPVTQPLQIIKKEMGNVNYWIKREVTDVSFEEYSNLADEYRATDTEIYYSNETGEISVEKYNTLEPYVQSTYTELTRTIYQEINIVTSKKNEDGHDILEVRQELVNVLDEHGQIQWEDDPSGATEKAYKIRYLDADGNITDEANHVYKAAYVGCTYHCG